MSFKKPTKNNKKIDQAKKVIVNSNVTQLNVRIDKSLMKRLSLIACSKDENIKDIVSKLIYNYIALES